MFNPSRDEVRRFFCTAWNKHLNRMPLEGAEVTVVDIIQRHAEYHALLTNTQAVLQQDWTPEEGQMNPFLHLSLHLAIAEQVGIDQPPGIRAAYQRLLLAYEPHAAEHVLLECLGETIWKAQRNGTAMDALDYLDRVHRAAGG